MGEEPVSRKEKRFEIIATLVLSFAALATAWAGYQSSLWDGIQTSSYSRATALRTSAALKDTEANQYRLADLGMFENWIDAKASGDAELEQFYRTRFRPEFKKAFEAWIALAPLDGGAAPNSPFAMPGYQLEQQAAARALTKQAEETFAEGEAANGYSDIFTLATLLFACSLFFAGISERFEFVPARVTLLTLAGLALIVGVVVSFTQPITVA